MSDLTIFQLVEHAKIDGPCSQGHQWKSVGGRGCDKCGGSQTVYQCERCGEYDYGEEGGPAYEECKQYCHIGL